MIKLLDANAVTKSLIDRFGLGLVPRIGKDANGDYIEFGAADIHPNEGFSIRITFGWKSLEAAFLPGKWARTLVQEMGAAPEPKKEAFSALSKTVRELGGAINFSINSSRFDPEKWVEWPTDWSEVALSLHSGPTNFADAAQAQRALLFWANAVLGLVVLLLPVEEVSDQEEVPQGLPEGASTRVEVNRYERSKINRAVCVAVHGYMCSVCGFDFAATYGSLGDHFIHVHHVVPVAAMGANYIVNPVKDLVPVCANCHAMIHRNNPPMSVDALKGVLAPSKK